MSIQEYREMTVENLTQELLALKRAQFNLRIQRGTGEAPKQHLFRSNRRNIARIKTVIAQKKHEGEKS